ncbi:MAG: sulfatase-like hydrolase/transferase [Planctomycetaceae bacterium]|nr:sulfatase-like hydrolase/transferase [Planctomycetaceae bacterium]
MVQRIVLTAKLIGVLIVCGLASVPGRAADDAVRPNILLICVDDLKPQLACYGDPLAVTPNIDRLASRGVLFQAAYCNQAVCSPSRNSLMTGLRPQTLGIYDLPTHFRFGAPDAVTVVEQFRRSGYHTEGLGKILHTGHGNHEDEASWSVPHWRPSASGYALPESTDSKRVRNGQSRGTATESADVPDNRYADGLIAEEAVRRLEAAAKQPEQPFLIAVGFLKPHLPFVAPQKYWDLYDRSRIPLPVIRTAPLDAPSYAPTNGGELRSYSDMPESGPVNDADTLKLIHGYYAATSYTDAQVGRLLDSLDATGLSKNTIVVLWGDHGWHLGDHGMWCKHSNYEQAARIPLIVSVPGAASGLQTAALVETVDLYPTLCELSGVPLREGLDGQSFAGVIRDPSLRGRDSVTHVYPRSNRLGRAIRTDRYRLVEWKVPGAPADTAELELYDYQQDPLETRNIAGQSPAIVSELLSVLARQPEARPQVRANAEQPKKTNAGTTPKDRVAMFRKRDRNGDGVLTREEFLANQPDPDEAPKRFPRFDANGDGVLSETEFVRSGRGDSSQR